jgi:hypothetical protein
MDPHSCPTESSSSPAPFVHAVDRAVRLAFHRAYARFVDAYRIAAARLKRGEQADFPAGAFPPRGPFVPTSAAAA